MNLPGLSPRSLVWDGDVLVDWANGGTRYHLNGTIEPGGIPLGGGSLDAAVSTEDGRYAAVYERLGTHGLLLRDGQVLRELTRADHHAEAYEYPVALTCLADGRVLLAHCPDEYNVIELEEAVTGKRLTAPVEAASDFFHSRLRFSPGGNRLLSAGWVWHPWDSLAVFDVAQVQDHPNNLTLLPLNDSVFAFPEETRGADFLDDDTVVAAVDPDSEGAAQSLLWTFSVPWNELQPAVNIPIVLGTIWGFGTEVLALHAYPRLYDVRTGQLLAQWPDLKSGQQESSIIHHIERPVPCAVDRPGRRVALGTPTGVSVIWLNP